jgi:hypothetical protein
MKRLFFQDDGLLSLEILFFIEPDGILVFLPGFKNVALLLNQCWVFRGQKSRNEHFRRPVVLELLVDIIPILLTVIIE